VSRIEAVGAVADRPWQTPAMPRRFSQVDVTQDPDSTIWVDGGTVTCIRGDVDM
jgi:hypothetical protein